MTLLTREQLDQIGKEFGLMPIAESIQVRDGIVYKGDMVWWRNEKCPEYVNSANDWFNIKKYPDVYQLDQPKVKYED